MIYKCNAIGIKKPVNLDVTLANVMESIVNGKEILSGFTLLKSDEGLFQEDYCAVSLLKEQIISLCLVIM